MGIVWSNGVDLDISAVRWHKLLVDEGALCPNRAHFGVGTAAVFHLWIMKGVRGNTLVLPRGYTTAAHVLRVYYASINFDTEYKLKVQPVRNWRYYKIL